MPPAGKKCSPESSSRPAGRSLTKSAAGPIPSSPLTGQAALPEAAGCVTGITLDAGALIALDRHDRHVLVLIARAMGSGMRVTVPATALAQAIRYPAKQARLSRLIRQPFTDVVPLDARHAAAVGLLLAESGTSDIADAHVAVCAPNAHQPVLTSDPGDLSRLPGPPPRRPLKPTVTPQKRARQPSSGTEAHRRILKT